MTDFLQYISEPLEWSAHSTDQKTHQIRWLSDLIDKSPPKGHLCGCKPFDVRSVTLTAMPSVVYFLIPGNPGVSSAYLPWLKHLKSKIADNSLICLSSHLGHLTEADPTFETTCETNVAHQAEVLESILVPLMRHSQAGCPHELPKIYLCGHSAGAYFILHGLRRVFAAIPHLHVKIHLIFYCGTLIQFGDTGTLKALIAASEKGSNWLRKVRTSDWMVKKVSGEPFHQMLLDEFSEGFLANMSTLTKDELQALPRDAHEQMDLIDELNVPVFFLLAANDAYVSRWVQKAFMTRYGPSRVFIGDDWWHAFPLHSAGFDEAATVTAGIVQEGLIPQKHQLTGYRRPLDLTGIMFDFRSGFAKLIVACWLFPGRLKRFIIRSPAQQGVSKGSA